MEFDEAIKSDKTISENYYKYYVILPVEIKDHKVLIDHIHQEKEELKNEFTCPICFCLVNNPLMCNFCDKLFCSECIKMWLKTNKKCITCRTDFQEGKIPRGFSNLLNKISLDCVNNCGVNNIKYEEYYKHLDQCEKLIKKTKCLGCNKIHSFNDIQDHVKTCSTAQKLKFDEDGSILNPTVDKWLLVIDVKPWEDDIELISLADRIKSDIIREGFTWKEYIIVHVSISYKRLRIFYILDSKELDIDEFREEIESTYEDDVRHVEIYQFEECHK